MACCSKCQEIDPHYEDERRDPSSELSQEIDAFNDVVAEKSRINLDIDSLPRQKTLSSAIDAQSLVQLREKGGLAYRAHLELLQGDGAGTWLHAIPSPNLGNKLDPQHCSIALRRRLRVPIFNEEFFCPLCDETMDVFGDHALTCGCGGDRTKRHNLLRNCCARLAAGAQMQPEIEKVGLLERRPDEERLEGESSQDARRPADIFLPRWHLGGSAALDFAVTSGLRGDCLADSARDGSSVLKSYEDRKRGFLDTAEKCRQAGILFVPMIIEAHSGAWGASAKKVLRELGRCTAMANGSDSRVEADRGLQALAVSLQRENARAVLRRTCPGFAASSSSPAAAAAAAAAADAASSV